MRRCGTLVQGHATWLEETRLECLELLLEAELVRGRHREVVGRLYALTTEHPLREMFYQKLMRALYMSDRRADALEVYRTAASRLDQEVGIRPCSALQDLHHSILLGAAPLTLCVTA
jgi:DNA-binding SARP family transcriptional activator